MTTIRPNLNSFDYTDNKVDKTISYETLRKFNEDRKNLVDYSKRPDQRMTYKDRFEIPYRTILTGIQELTDFSILFFSKENIEWLNKNIRYNVYIESNKEYIIDYQDETNLNIVMKTVYLQKSRNPQNKKDFQKEILYLNKLVLKEVVPKIISQIKQYTKYLEDIKKNPDPIALPINPSIKGTNSERGPSDVLGLNVFGI